MKYCLKLGQSFEKGMRRIAFAQIDLAAKHLGKDRGIISGVHDARKSLKRIRALLDLAEPALAKPDYRREDRRFRDLGRTLSGARDIAVMLQQLDALAVRGEIDAAGRFPFALRSWLLAKADEATAEHDNERREEAIAGLTKAREAIAGLAVSDRNFDAVARGFARSYAKGADAFSRAYDKRADASLFHDWRKHVQRHWRQCQLLRAAWPEALEARIALAGELSEIIGEDHDLAVLAAFARQNRAILGPPEELAAFAKACSRRQRTLRLMASPRGARLYALRPKTMAKMLAAYWKCARKIGHTPALDGAATSGAKIVSIN